MVPWRPRTTPPLWHRSRVSSPTSIRSVAALALLILATACQGQTPAPTPNPSAEATPPAPSPAPAAALFASPSPGLLVPSPVASPSAVPSAAVAETSFPIDDYPFAVMIDNISD